MSARPLPTAFFSLPRELRDQIYLETLSDKHVVFSEWSAGQNPGCWFRVRETSPGFYRPVIHMHKCEGEFQEWHHKAEIMPRPALFDITQEAIPIYLRDSVMLEMTVDDCKYAIDEWANQVEPAELDIMRSLYVLVHANAMLEPKISKTLEDKLESEDRPELEGPAFKIELRSAGQELVIRSRAQLANRHKWALTKSIVEWVGARRSSPNGSRNFTGSDLIEITKLIADPGGQFCFYVLERDVLGVVNYTCSGVKASELQLVETYHHVVANVRCRAGELSSISESANEKVGDCGENTDRSNERKTDCNCIRWSMG